MNSKQVSASGRPWQLFSAQQMYMYVVNGLAPVNSIIDHNSVTTFIKTFLFCNERCDEHQMAHFHLLVFFLVLKHAQILLIFWNYQNVGWSLGVCISKSHSIIVFVDNVNWNFLWNYFVKNCWLSKIFLILGKFFFLWNLVIFGWITWKVFDLLLKTEILG